MFQVMQRSLRLMVTSSCLLGLPLFGYGEPALHWSLDATDAPGLSLKGNAKLLPGVKGESLGLDGASVIELEDSGAMGHDGDEFSLLVWVNPHSLHEGQQMIAAKNHYAAGEREWSLMIDKDRSFRLYVWQGEWLTVESATEPSAGHWHLVGLTRSKDVMTLYVDGQKAGEVQFRRPLSRTDAPVTLGGVIDDGKPRQTLLGALDDVSFFSRALTAPDMAESYHPVATKHPVSEPFALWESEEILPKASEIQVLEDAEIHVIKRWEPDVDGYRWLHGVALAWHKGKLFASFGHNVGEENTLTEEARFCVSEDGGRTWGPVRVMDVGTEADDLAISHGVFLSREDELWAFLGAFHETRKRVHTRAYTFEESTGAWTPKGVVIEGGFWPMQEPVRMENGNWILPGLVIAQDGKPAGVAISRGNDLTSWDMVRIPTGSGVGSMWGESAIFVDGPEIVNIARYGSKPRALVAVSGDYGRTWTPSVQSNLPMATSKPAAGVLRNGQRYLACTTTADSGGSRFPLTIAVSRPGEERLSKVFVVRHAEDPEGPGESHPRAALSYPYAIEHDGSLYVGYSNSGGRSGNQNSAELAIIPLASLEF